MRFSEARIQALSRQIAKSLVDRGAVDKAISVPNLASYIEKAFIADARKEEEIEGEARERLLRQPKLPPEGSGEYEAMFSKLKEEIAARKGYPL